MKVVVTGATGCLGFALCKRLTGQGFDVIAMGRNALMGARLNELGAHFMTVDLGDAQALHRHCLGAEIIFHCAARSAPWGRHADFYQSNVVGTSHIIDATPDNARLIHVSSPSVYFDFTTKYDIKEDSPIPAQSANHYIDTKKQAELLIDEAVHAGLNALTLRPRGLFGPEDRALFPRILSAYRQGVFPLIGSGLQRIDITHVDNVTQLMMLMAFAPDDCVGEKYNASNDEPTEFITIIDWVFKALNMPVRYKRISPRWAYLMAHACEGIYRGLRLNKEPRFTRYTMGVMSLGQTLDITKAKQLGYRPSIGLEDGIKAFIHGRAHAKP